MSVTGANNVGLHVADLEGSLAFYRDRLGLDVERVSPALGPGPITAVSGTPQATLQIALLRIPGSDLTLTLATMAGVERTASRPAFQDPGSVHLSLAVDDLDSLLESLAAAGHAAIGPIADMTAGPRPARLAFVRDPDGFFVELVEPREG
jgi:catechol 2,3-dioxygenase-like lactoylglutathione lyase family enzyme